MGRKKYEEGGEVDPLEAANSSKEAQEIAGEAILKGMRDKAAAEPSTFKEAFAAARSRGDKNFEFGGKKYNTALAPARRPAPAAAPAPAPAPARAPMRQETMQDRAESYVAKRAAQRAADAEARAAERAKMPTSRPKASEQKFMGNSNYAKGGMASRRGDGIAQRGKTKGRII